MLANLNLTELLIVFITILVSMSFHEAMHAFTAYWLGDDTASHEGRLTLNPLKHIDTFTTVLLPLILLLLRLPPLFIAKPVPFNPERVRYGEFGAALVGIAGPLTNLGLAALGALVFHGIGPGLSTGVTDIIEIFVAVNVAFFVFNMIPFPPLDGSRLLYAVAPEPVQRVMYQIESMGLAAIFIFFFVALPLLGPVISMVNEAILNFLL